MNSCSRLVSYGTVSPKIQGSYVLKDVEIECHSETIPRWFKDGIELLGTKYIIQYNKLTIASVKGIDSGVYTCRGTTSPTLTSPNSTFTSNSTLYVGGKT